MLTFLLLSSALAVTVAEVPRPAGDAWISDVAQILASDQEAELNARLTGLNRDLGVEVVVVTVPAASSDPKSFATEIYNTWQVGHSERDDGLVVLLVMDARRLEMETGYGLEGALPDGWLGGMQQEFMVPLFKLGDFGGGLQVGLTKVDERLRSFPGGLPAAGPVSAESPEAPPHSGFLVWMVLGVSVVGIVLLVLAVVAWSRRQQRLCPNCKTVMSLLDEVADDAHLTDGQKLEEGLTSVDHEVRVCTTCGHVKRIEHVFRGYEKCPKCGVRAYQVTRHQTVKATTESGGVITTTKTCKNCGINDVKTRVTPVISRPSYSSSSSSSYSSRSSASSSRSSSSSSRSSSSSSSSSRSSSSSSRSFGGGRSRGGGAGSSW